MQNRGGCDPRKQEIVSGQGGECRLGNLSAVSYTHLNIIISKLKERFNVDVVTSPRKIAYRETIKGHSDVQGKHKKQSGGAGQYGDVHIRFSPSPDKVQMCIRDRDSRAGEQGCAYPRGHCTGEEV